MRQDDRPEAHTEARGWIGVLSLSAVLLAGAYLLGYVPLAAVGLAGLCACALAGLAAYGRLGSAAAELSLSAVKVERGSRIEAVATVGHTSVLSLRTPSVVLAAGPGLRIEDARRDAKGETRFDVLAARRGTTHIGPLVVERSDPFRLLIRRRALARPVPLIVRPVARVLPFGRIAPHGEGRSEQGIAADGGIAFDSLREYVDGDDIRRVHWLASLRNPDGDLLVRVSLDPPDNEHLIVLDTNPDSYSPAAEDFETAVDAAASLALSYAAACQPFRLSTSGGLRTLSRGTRADGARLLDLLADVRLADPGGPHSGVATALTSIKPARVADLVIVTGIRGTEAAAAGVAASSWCPEVALLRVADRDAALSTAADVVIRTLDDLVSAWPTRPRRHARATSSPTVDGARTR